MKTNDGYKLVMKKFPYLCLYARLAMTKLLPILANETPKNELQVYSMFIAHNAVLRCMYEHRGELLQSPDYERDALICYFVVICVDYFFIEMEARDYLKVITSKHTYI